MRSFAALLFACSACGASTPSSQHHTSVPECAAVAQHIVAIGPVERWIAEAREDELLPVNGASDREGLQKFLELGCRDNWPVAQRRCVVAQATWSDVERSCSTEKVWWYEPT